VLKRCAKRGHVLARLADAELAARFSATSAQGPLLRCLRCGDFVPAGGPPTSTVVETLIGTAENPVPLGDVPHAVRGGHGRKLALLRLLAIERCGRGLVLLLAAAGFARLAGS
jgi:hypothetical protein